MAWLQDSWPQRTSRVDCNMPEGIWIRLESFGRQFYRLMKRNWNCLDQQYVWCEKGQAYDQKNTKPSIKHRGGSLMMWGCFSAAGNGNLGNLYGIMDTHIYQAILRRNVMHSVEKSSLRDHWTMIPSTPPNDPKPGWEINPGMSWGGLLIHQI